MQSHNKNTPRQKREKGGKGKNSGDRRNFGRAKPHRGATSKGRTHQKEEQQRSSDSGVGKSEHEGVMMIAGKKGGFVMVGDAVTKSEREIHIYPDSLKTALHGDTVIVRINSKRGITKNRAGEQEETGEVVRVTLRSRNRFVGLIDKAEFVPDDRRFYLPIKLTWNLRFQVGEKADVMTKENAEGQKVLIEITDWLSSPIEAKVIQNLGKKGDHETEMRSILAGSGIVYDFPPEVEHEAEALDKAYLGSIEYEASIRRDIRDTLTFTIDPFDAKDFDDAISYKELGGGKYEIGIHIADVSHFVRPGTSLDVEGASRANSVYLVDRTIPMLPEVLSAGICSLVPNQDRLTYSAIFDIDDMGKVSKEWFGRTIIHSDKRFTYEEAADILRQGSGTHYKELDIINKIAKNLHKARVARGTVIFDKDEIKIELDKDKRPIRIVVKERLETHKLIEELMLLANKHVAIFLDKAVGKHGGASMYRIHNTPDPDRIANLELFLKSLGFKIEGDWKNFGYREINQLFLAVQGKEIENLVQTAVLRSMSKAVYSMQNIGHFGLGFDFYTHFTSPIRRYPDVMVHRLLTKYLDNKPIGATEVANFERIAKYSSSKEKEAEQAERESIKYKQAEYMLAHMGKGEVFEGTITGVTEWGFFVEDKLTKSEGLVRLANLDDYFEFNEKKFSLIGRKSKKVYRLGDSVKVKLAEVDVDRHQITWEVA